LDERGRGLDLNRPIGVAIGIGRGVDMGGVHGRWHARGFALVGWVWRWLGVIVHEIVRIGVGVPILAGGGIGIGSVPERWCGAGYGGGSGRRIDLIVDDRV
jgi:hypothetical protein